MAFYLRQNFVSAWKLVSELWPFIYAKILFPLYILSTIW